MENCQTTYEAYLCDLPSEWRKQIATLMCQVKNDRDTFDCDDVKDCETLTSLSAFTIDGTEVCVTYKDENGVSAERCFDVAETGLGSGGEDPLTFSQGLTRVSDTITNDFTTGKGSSQVLYGGTTSGGDLTISSTVHATKGDIFIGTSVYNEVSDELRLAGIADKGDYKLQVGGNVFIDGNILTWDDGVSPVDIVRAGETLTVRATNTVLECLGVGSIILDTPGGIALSTNSNGTATVPIGLGVGGNSFVPTYVFDFDYDGVDISVDYRGANFGSSTSTFDTVGGDVTFTLGHFSASGTRVSGANDLINVGIYATASNGQQNYAAQFVGKFKLDLGSDATGDIYYRNSSGDFVRLPIGTNGQTLTVVGGLPAWV